MCKQIEKEIKRMVKPTTYAKIKGIAPKTVYRQMHEGRLNHVRIDGTYFVFQDK